MHLVGSNTPYKHCMFSVDADKCYQLFTFCPKIGRMLNSRTLSENRILREVNADRLLVLMNKLVDTQSENSNRSIGDLRLPLLKINKDVSNVEFNNSFSFIPLLLLW